jgi:hypothetical protein
MAAAVFAAAMALLGVVQAVFYVRKFRRYG